MLKSAKPQNFSKIFLLDVVPNDVIKRNEIKRHRPLLPDSIRAIICGPSGCGKTNLMISILLDPKGLKFENIYLYGKMLNQPKYDYLRLVMERVLRLVIILLALMNTSSTLKKQMKILSCIFDDVALENQDIIRKFFCMGRHKHLDCFYLTQTCTRIPKHLIRDNANFVILFNQDDLNLKHIYNDHLSSPDISFQTFKDMCYLCWKDEPHGFIVIDKTSPSSSGRYRKGFDAFIIL